MLGLKAIIAGAMLLLLAATAPAAYADQVVLSDQQYRMSDKDIIVHIKAVNVADFPHSNIMPQPDMKYYQLIYNFENIGDTEDRGFIQPTFIDSSGSQYRYMEYTSVNVRPHHTSADHFIEMPVPKDRIITKIVFIDGFDNHTFNLANPASTSSPAPSGSPTASATPAPGANGWSDCLPLIPFAMAGGIAGAGIVINRCGLKRR